MKSLIAFITGLLWSMTALAQLTDAQMQTLASGLRGSSVPAVQAAVAARADYDLMLWCNTASATGAWHEAASAGTLVDASPLTLYDGLTAGKRSEFELLLRYNEQLDMRVQAKRDTIVDAWGTASRSVPILQAGTRKATNCELIFGGVNETTNTVTAIDLARPGSVYVDDISDALNRY